MPQHHDNTSSDDELERDRAAGQKDAPRPTLQEPAPTLARAQTVLRWVGVLVRALKLAVEISTTPWPWT